MMYLMGRKKSVEILVNKIEKKGFLKILVGRKFSQMSKTSGRIFDQ